MSKGEDESYVFYLDFNQLSHDDDNVSLDFISAISGAAKSISNVGPGLGEMIGPNGNFSEVSNVSKWILSFAMLLGRLEIFAVLVLFLPSFWRS